MPLLNGVICYLYRLIPCSIHPSIFMVIRILVDEQIRMSMRLNTALDARLSANLRIENWMFWNEHILRIFFDFKLIIRWDAHFNFKMHAIDSLKNHSNLILLVSQVFVCMSVQMRFRLMWIFVSLIEKHFQMAKYRLKRCINYGFYSKWFASHSQPETNARSVKEELQKHRFMTFS